MTDQPPTDPTPFDESLFDESPTDPTSTDPTPTEPAPAKGLRGLLRRRAEVVLRKPRRASAALTEPGDCHVVLQQIGSRPVHVMAVISQATGLDLVSASDLARETPVVVVSGISEDSADRVVERLQKVGAKAVAGAAYRPQ